MTPAPVLRTRFRRSIAVIGSGALAIAATVSAAAGETPASAATPTPGVPAFASPTVVDNYRPGFEPDVAVDRSPGGAGRIYTSTPFGFTTTQSFIERSDDNAASFHQIAGNITGKPANCIGGGDTEAMIDPVNGALYFADLQGLTNYSASRSDNQGGTFAASCASVNGTAVDRQWIGDDSNGGTSAVGPGAGDGRLYFDYDNVVQSTNPATFAGNQLVLNESLDGVQYGTNCAGTSAGGVIASACPGLPVVISPDEGLPGNLIVDNTRGGKFQHSVYAVHTNRPQTSMTMSICRGAASGAPASAAAAAAYCTDPTTIPADTSRVSTHWHDVAIDIPNAAQGDKAFPIVAADTAGNLYVTWASAPLDPMGSGGQAAPAQVYLSRSTDGGEHWSPRETINAPAQRTNIYPWITAGDAGRVDIAWYASQDSTGAVPYDSDSLNAGHWDVYNAQLLDALSPAPTVTVSKVSDHYVKFGNISTGGLGGASDRSLGDYMQVQTDLDGAAVITYVDDTSDGRNQDFTLGSGQSPPEAAGPTMVVPQIGGPSLYDSVGNLGGRTAAIDAVDAPTGNSFYAQATTDTAAAANQDITGVSIGRPSAGTLEITERTADPNLAKDLAFSPTLGGSTGVWMVRWADRYDKKADDGHIHYVAMQSTSGGSPAFYDGQTTCIATTRCKYFSYPTTGTPRGKIVGNSIVWDVPLSDIASPVDGDTLFSVTGTTVSQLAPSTAAAPVELPSTGNAANTQLPATLDSAPSFSYTLRASTIGTTTVIPAPGQLSPPKVVPIRKTVRKSETVTRKPVVAKKTGAGQGGGRPKGTLASTGLDAGIPSLALALAGVGLTLRRRSRRAARHAGSGSTAI